MPSAVVVIPVADVDRAKSFYARLGWRLDADTPPARRPVHAARLRVLGPVRPDAHIGCARFRPRVYLVVSDIEAARNALAAAGVDVSEVFHARPRPARSTVRIRSVVSYFSRATFSDPDGNFWLLQEITTRLPGRVDPADDVVQLRGDLASAMRRAAAAHGEHEKRTGEADANWPDWYAEYMVAEQAGTELPT